jgi:predicted N-acetyltransferase YhbS
VGTERTPAGAIEAPRPLGPQCDCSGFDSGQPALDIWLKRNALRSQSSGAARTYVITSGQTVIGYYALAVGSVARAEATGPVRRNMPDPIPVMLLARLAVDRRWQGQGLGAGLLRDAVLRTLQAAKFGGIRAMLVHAISTDAARFYRYFGFQPSPATDMTLMAALSALEGALVADVNPRPAPSAGQNHEDP